MLKSRAAAFLFLSSLGVQVSLAATPDPLANIRKCAAQADAAQRLACYDQQFRILDSRAQAATAAPAQPNVGAAAATVSAAAASAPPAATAEQRFGMNGDVERSNPTTQPPKIEQLSGRIAAVGYKPHGETIIKLENGQVWEEADGEDPVELKVGQAVTIDTGLMGAYWLRFGKHGSVRVKRTH